MSPYAPRPVTWTLAGVLLFATTACGATSGSAAAPATPAPKASVASPVVTGGVALGCDPRGNGATGDGHTLDTVAIQKTLTACAGQVVQLSAGTYVSGPLFIPTGTTFSILPGATLRATEDSNAFHG